MNDLINDLAVLSMDIAEEGANRDATKLSRQYKKEFKVLMKGIKSAYKEGKYDEAMKGCDAGIALMKKFKDEMEAACGEQTIGEVVIGYFLRYVQSFGYALLLVVPVFGLVELVKASITDITTLIKAIGNAIDGDFRASDINYYTKAMEKSLDKYSVTLNRMKKKIQAAKSTGEKPDARAEESVFSVDDFVGCGMTYMAAVEAYSEMLYYLED